MPVFTDPDEPGVSRLVAPDGRRLAAFQLRTEDVAIAGRFRLEPDAEPAEVAARVRQDLAGHQLATTDVRLRDALLASDLPLIRSASDLVHELTDIEPPAELRLPAGWSLTPWGWDPELPAVIEDAYRAPHPDGGDQTEHLQTLRAVASGDHSVPCVASASAGVQDGEGVLGGHILTGGPVPWAPSERAWVLDVALAWRARGSGIGPILLWHAIAGTAAAGFTSLGLSVTDNNPARRLYDAVGFRAIGQSYRFAIPIDPRSEETGSPSTRAPRTHAS